MNRSNAPEFRALTVRHDGRVNRILTKIALSRAFDPKHPPDPPYPHHSTMALWDTGATTSVITKETVQALNLVPTGTTLMGHAGGTTQCPTYVVNIYLPNNVGIVGRTVAQPEHIVGDFGAIIGMDIITLGDMAITNVNNQTCMTFRVPSIQTIDYVDDVNRHLRASVGRNDPCPCGRKQPDGKPVKFKNCHGK